MAYACRHHHWLTGIASRPGDITWTAPVLCCTRHATALGVYVQVVCLDLEPYMVEFSQPFFESSGLSQRIKPVIGPADETMKQLAQQGDR